MYNKKLKERFKNICIIYAIFSPLFIIAFASTAMISEMKAVQIDLNLSDTITQWQIVGYAVFAAAAVPIVGQLGDIFGNLKIFKIGIFLAIVSSILLSIGTGTTTVILGNLIRGLSAAFIFPHSLSVPSLIFPSEKLKKIVFVFGIALPTGWILGPFFGGLFALVNWRLLFWIKLAFLIPSMFILLFYKINTRQDKSNKKVDYLGSTLIFLGLVSLILILSEGGSWGWTSPQQIVLYAICPLLLILFFYSQTKISKPLIIYKVCYNKFFITGSILMMSALSCLFNFFYFTNYYFLSPTGQNSSYLIAGSVLVPPIAVTLIISLVTMKICRKFFYKVTSCFGLFILFSGMLILIWLPNETSYLNLWWRFIIIGAGLGISTMLGSPLAMATIKDEDKGMATGVYILITYIGISIIIPISQIWYNYTETTQMMNYLNFININHIDAAKIINSAHKNINELNLTLQNLGLSKVQITDTINNFKKATQYGFGKFGLVSAIFAAIGFIFCLLFAPNHKVLTKK